jgi:mannobiose 2-epimerase
MRVLLVFLAVATARAAAEADLLKQIDGLTSSTFGFWQRHGLDAEYGGFHGTLSRDGTPIRPTKKGLVQTARHLWAFSAYHQQHGGTPAADMAASAYSFLTTHLLDAPSSMFHWSVSRDGTQVVDGRKVLYGQWFAIYGISKYAEVFGNGAAKEAARACLDAMDAAYHNSTTGGCAHVAMGRC